MSKKSVAVSLRRPEPRAEVDAFVAGPSSAIPASPPANAVDTVVRHGAREFREMTLYLPSDVARQLSFHCIDQNCDANGVVAQAVSKYLSPDTAEKVAPATRINFDRRTLDALIESSRRSLAGLFAKLTRLPV